MIRERMNKTTCTILAAALTVGAIGCETKTQTGALVGGVGGAGIGAAIGSNNGSAGKGALIGGAVGALGGALVGNSMDQQDAKKAKAQEEERRREERTYAKSTSSKSVSKQDVVDWSEDGLSDDVIIDRIDRSNTIFRMSAKDENTLRDSGVSEEVIRAMKDTAHR